jgi:2-iminobutanoate/2-iminopropanoate deaminase
MSPFRLAGCLAVLLLPLGCICHDHVDHRIHADHRHMKLTTVHTDHAPKAIGPYSQAIAAGNLVFCSGQIALDPESGEMVGDTAAAQAELVMKNLKSVLQAAGSDFGNVVRTTIFLADMGDFGAVNEVYGRYFPDHKPARATVAVKQLPKSALVEIDCIACIDSAAKTASR